MSSALKSYRAFDRWIKGLQILMGLWPDHDDYARVLKKILGALTCLIYGVMTAAATYYCVEARTMSAFARGLASSLTFFSVLVRVSALLLREENLKKLNEGVCRFFREDLKNPDNHPYLLQHLNFLCKIYLAFSTLLIFELASMISKSLVSASAGKYDRVFTIAVPYDFASDGFNHWATFAFELVYSVYLWAAISTVDFSLIFYSILCVGELKLLAKKFQDLKSDESYPKHLKQLVDRHNELMNAHHILEDLYGTFVVWVCVVDSVTLCMLVYQVNMLIHALSVWEIIYLWSFAILKVMENFVFAWSGDTISRVSEECIEAVSRTAWTSNDDLRFRKDLLIVLSQKPLTYSARGLMILDFKMFVKFINATVSYYLFVRKIDEKN